MSGELHPDVSAVLAGERRWAVVHGDCLELLAHMADKSGVVVTDVPYGVGKAIHGDDLPWEKYLPWLDARLAECVRVGKRVFTFYAATRLLRFVRETTVPPVYPLHWHKPMMFHDRGLNGSPFLAHGEPILYWGPKSAKEAGKRGYDSFAAQPLWPSDRREAGIDHPTPKPIELLLKAMPFWTDPDDIVIDPFCGSGTHLVAAVRLGRRAIGFDIDAQWVAHTIDHLEAEDGFSSLGAARTGQEALFR